MFLALLILGFAALVLPGTASAQGCYIGSGGAVAFGTVSPDANTDTVNNLAYTCQSNASTTYFRICMTIPEGTPLAGINPRLMTNYNGAQMQYNLYSDAARTQIIGAPPAGAGFPIYSFTAVVTGNYVQQPASAPIYARVPAGQNLPANNAFQSQIGGGTLSFAWSNSGYPADCTSGTGTGSATFFQGVSATVSNSCRITLATDLDFGNAGSLTTNRDQTSTVMLRCPVGTSWRLSLNNGSNASGAVRRMRSPAGGYINYELYQNSARTQRWGTSTAEMLAGTGAGEGNPQSQSVYGRVPAQASAPLGTYTDTVIVTLTY